MKLLYTALVFITLCGVSCDSRKPSVSSEQQSVESLPQWVFAEHDSVESYFKEYFSGYGPSGGMSSFSQDKISHARTYFVDESVDGSTQVEEFEVSLKKYITTHGWEVACGDRTSAEYHDGSKHMGFRLDAKSGSSSYVIYVDVNLSIRSKGKREVRFYWKSLKSA